MTVPKAQFFRLRKRAEFLFVQKGFKAARAGVMVEARRRTGTGPSGVGFTATKRLGGAVARNRARRRLREAVRAILPAHAVAGVDYVFVARPATLETPYARLLDDVQNALIRLAADLNAPSAPRPARAPRAPLSEND